jgi:ABC-type Fe3+/spermidine/putrescine transport system ATPase subunit
MGAISLQDVETSVSGERVLSDISLDIEPGEFCVVIGPSGGGKSTLLRSIAGLVTPSSGSVQLRETDVSELSPTERAIGFVFQEFEDTLFPHKTVAENVAFGLEQQAESYSAEEVNAKIDEMLELLSISQTRETVPGELSGGQQQRVELARQLVRDCDIMLLDDPLADLDYKLQKRLELDLHRLQRERESTFVYVTHDQDQALKLADKLVVLNEGRIEQVGTPHEVYNEPKTAFVARFVGDSNLFVSEVNSQTGTAVTVNSEIGEISALPRADSPPGSGEGVTVVRPENIQLGEDAKGCENSFNAILEEQTYSGEYTEYHVSIPVGERKLIVVETGQPRFDTVDQDITVGWGTDDAQFYQQLSITENVTISDLQEL